MPSSKIVRVSVLSVATGLVVALGAAWTSDRASTAKDQELPTWTPNGQLPGVPLEMAQLPARARAGALAVTSISPGIDATTLREVVSGDFGTEMRLVTARDSDGSPCVSVIFASGGGRQFSCFGAATDDGPPLVRFVSDGGTKLGAVEWVDLVGLARSDVARVTLVAQDGREHALALNAWRGFAYSTRSPDDFPQGLRAYDSAGSVIAEQPTPP